MYVVQFGISCQPFTDESIAIQILFCSYFEIVWVGEPGWPALQFPEILLTAALLPGALTAPALAPPPASASVPVGEQYQQERVVVDT